MISGTSPRFNSMTAPYRACRIVADIGNAFEALLANELADAHQQVRLVYLIGQLVDDDGEAAAFFSSSK